MSLRRSPRQIAASSPAVATVGGRETRNAAFRGSGRGADQQVGYGAALVQGVYHPRLHGAQGGTAGQHERSARRSRRAAAGRRAGGDGDGAHRRSAPAGRVLPGAGSPVTVAGLALLPAVPSRPRPRTARPPAASSRKWLAEASTTKTVTQG